MTLKAHMQPDHADLLSSQLLPPEPPLTTLGTLHLLLLYSRPGSCVCRCLFVVRLHPGRPASVNDRFLPQAFARANRVAFLGLAWSRAGLPAAWPALCSPSRFFPTLPSSKCLWLP